MLRFGRHRGLGVTIGPAAIETADLVGRTRGWSYPLAPLPDGAVRWPALVTALQELRTARGRGGALDVALLPPFAEVRVVTLPPLAADETRQVLARTPGRYFLGAREPQVIGIASTTESGKKTGAKGPRPVVTAAAAARLVEAIHAAAAEAGWTVHTVAPAEAAWRAAALAMWPELRQGSHDVAVLRSDRTDVIHLDGGVLTSVRRIAAGMNGAAAGDTLAHDGAMPAAGALAVLGPTSMRDAFVRSLGSARGRVLAPSASWAAVAESAERAAAAFVADVPDLRFVSDAARQRQHASRARLTAVAAIAAVALIAGAATLELWGARRALEDVRRERAALGPETAGLVATRDSAARIGQRLHELGTATSRTVPWSDVLTTVTRALPHDAYLTAFRASGDSLVLDGVAERSADVFAALKSVPGFTDVRSAAPVRQQLGDRATAASAVLERFSVAARLVSANDTLGLALGAEGRER